MKYTTVVITYGRKINLGNYNNANLEMTLGAELDEGDNQRAVMDALWEEAKASVKAQLSHLLEASKPKNDKEDF